MAAGGAVHQGSRVRQDVTRPATRPHAAALVTGKIFNGGGGSGSSRTRVSGGAAAAALEATAAAPRSHSADGVGTPQQHAAAAVQPSEGRPAARCWRAAGGRSVRCDQRWYLPRQHRRQVRRLLRYPYVMIRVLSGCSGLSHPSGLKTGLPVTSSTCSHLPDSQ